MSEQVSVKVSADSTAFAAGLARVENSLESFKHHADEQFKELGKGLLEAFALSAVVEGIKSLFEQFSQIQDIADKLGTTAESVQRLGQVAKQSGVDTETLIKTLQKGTAKAFEAATGNEELAQSFEAIGVDAKEFANESPEEQLKSLSEGFQKAGYSAQWLAGAQKALGKSAIELQGLLARGPEELTEALNSAKVASNETVANLKAQTEKFESYWNSFKAFGAEALNYVIERVKALGTGFAAIGAYVANLTHGLNAASKAYDDVIQAAADLNLEEEKKRADETKRHKPLDTDAIEAAKSKAEEEKKDAEELGKLKEQNAKKEEEAHFRNLTLLQKQMELQGQIAALQSKVPKDELDAQEKYGKRLDAQKELEQVNKEIEREAETAQKERAAKEKRAMQEQTREALAEKKKELKGAEDWLRETTNKKEGFSVDSLRAVGGGIAGANYKADTAKIDMQRQQVDYARQQVEKLTRVVAALEKQEQAIVSYDGSFSS